MAVAARPGPSDARVPCPLCGGLIHPIAGKCKHCKADLTGYHAARPAASTPLPALHRPSNGHAPPGLQANGDTTRATAHAAIATAVSAAEAQPVLPPRPAAPGPAAEPSAWRSWPVLVIMIAMLAILAAVVLMVWPETSARGDRGKRPLPPPPAPEHMPTTVPDPRTAPKRQSQAPRASSSAPADPWATPSDPPAKDPGGKPDSADDSNDSTDDDDLAPLKDPLSDPHASHGSLRFNRPGALFGAIVVHLCRKMIECGNADPLVANQCDRFSRVMPPPPSNCPAATRCFQHIDAMQCGTQPATLANVPTLLNQFADCHEAIRC
jgi:hypothetical protein